MLAPVYTRCQELKKAKRHNRLAAFGKKEQIPVTTTKEQIKKEGQRTGHESAETYWAGR